MDNVDWEVLNRAARWLDEDYRVTHVTVVKTWGSSPRPIGSVLAVRHDRRSVGSVSGGCVEDDLMKRICNGAVAAERPEVLQYGVTREESQRFGLPCGGTLQLVAEPIFSGFELNGLAIGSKTPPEIAISILAEITAVRRGAAARKRSHASARTIEAAGR